MKKDDLVRLTIGSVYLESEGKWHFWVMFVSDGSRFWNEKSFDTYQEAEAAAVVWANEHSIVPLQRPQ